MKAFEAYIHGNPYGQQIVGSQKNREYIRKFYSFAREASSRNDEAILIIEICAADVYYTYLRPKGMCDSQGRSGAFFAITLSFEKEYCSKVYKLFQLFEAIYEQVCLDSFIERRGAGGKYLVGDFNQARKDSQYTVDVIQEVLNHKIPELLSPYIHPLSQVTNTYDMSTKEISLKDVDSPMFMEYFEKHSILVSPSLPSATVRYEAIAKQKDVLVNEVAKLKSELSSLSSDKESLSKQLNSQKSRMQHTSSESSAMKQDIEKITQERDDLRCRLNEVADSISQIKEPFSSLVGLFSGRLGAKKIYSYREVDIEQSEVSRESSTGIWSERVSQILLALVMVLCCIILVLVISNGRVQVADTDVDKKENADSVVSQSPKDVGSIAQTAKSNSVPGNESAGYDSWNDCKINIVNGGDSLEVGKSYELELLKLNSEGKLAKDKDGKNISPNVSVGNWVVKVDGIQQPINYEQPYFTIAEDYKGKCVTISYEVNGKEGINRKCMVKNKSLDIYLCLCRYFANLCLLISILF